MLSLCAKFKLHNSDALNSSRKESRRLAVEDQPERDFSQCLRDARGEVVGVRVGLPGPAAAGPAGLGMGNANVGDSDGDAAGDLPGDGDCAGDDVGVTPGDGEGLSVGVGVGGGGMIFSQ
jgi:hypothetical protein